MWKKVGILLLDKNFSNYHLVPVWCWARWLDHWAERWWRVHCVRAAPGTSFSYDSCCKGLGCTRKIKQNMTLRLNLQISLVHICPSFIYQYYKHRLTENWSFLTIQEIKNKSLDLLCSEYNSKVINIEVNGFLLRLLWMKKLDGKKHYYTHHCCKGNAKFVKFKKDWTIKYRYILIYWVKQYMTFGS